MAYIGVVLIDVQTTIISVLRTQQRYPSEPTFVSLISGAPEYSSALFKDCPTRCLETQADYNVWVFEAFNSQHSPVDTTEPAVPVDGELYFDIVTEELSLFGTRAVSNTERTVPVTRSKDRYR